MTVHSPLHSNKPLWQTFFVFLWPMMLANILQALSGTVNNVFLGRMIGVEALAAATAFFPIIFFLNSFMIGIGSGASVLVGRAWGAKDPEQARKVTGTTYAMVLIGGVIITAIGHLGIAPILTLLGTPANIYAESLAYARIMLTGMPILFLFFTITSILRGVGDSVTPLYTLLFSTTAALLVTPAFIQGWLGLPQLGVASAAVASIASMTIGTIWVSWYLRKKNHPLAPNAQLLKHVRIDLGIFREVLALGLPTGVQMIVISLAEIVLIGLVNGFGSNATAAYGAVIQILNYTQFPAMSIGIAASILGAQAIGAHMKEQLIPIVRTGLLLNLVITGALVLVAYIFSGQVLSAFLNDAEVLVLAQRLLFIVLWSIVPFGFSGVFTGVMRASGVVIPPMLITIAGILFIELPVAYGLSRTAIGVNGVWIGFAATFVAAFIFQGLLFQLKWRKSYLAEEEAAAS